MTCTVSPAAGSWVLQTSSATQTHAFTTAARPSANAIPVVAWIDRTGSLTVDAVSDDTNGAWSILVNTTLSGNRFIVATPTSGNALPLNADVHTTGSGNSQMLAGWIDSDVQLVTLSGTPTSVNDAASNTDTDSNTVTITGRGGVISFIYTPSAQTTTPTMDGAGEVSLKAGEAGLRILGVFEPQAAAGTFGTETTLATASTTSIITFGFTDESVGASPPSITNVDTDNTITATQTNVVITGTDFDTATVGITQGSTTVAQSIDSQNATTIQFDVVFDAGATDLKYGAATLTVTNGDAQADTQAITIAAPSGKNYVTLTSVNGTAGNRLTASPDLEINDQVEWSNVAGGAIGDVTVNADGTFDCDSAVTSFDIRVWDNDDSTWGSLATQSTADTIPNAFSFNDATNAPLSTVTTSDPVTIGGLDAASAISVTGGSYSINGGSFETADGTVVDGDVVRARGTSSGSNSTAVNVVVTIGTVADTFTVTTQEEPPPITTGAGRKRDGRARRGPIRLLGRG